MKRDLLERIDLYLINEEYWSASVTTKWSPPEGLFKRSAQEIAKVIGSESDSLKQAISRINFYQNRAGKNLDKGRKAVLNRAKNLVRQKFGEKPEKEEEEKGEE